MGSAASLGNIKKDNKLLLLLSVKLPTSSVRLPNVKCDPSTIFTRSIHTQTEKPNEADSGVYETYDLMLYSHIQWETIAPQDESPKISVLSYGLSL